VQEVLHVDLIELLVTGLAAEDAAEGGPGHFGVGLARRAVLTDVGGNAVELLERRLPAAGA
jgi:hypothetical protein